jgi:hypothetical protein
MLLFRRYYIVSTAMVSGIAALTTLGSISSGGFSIPYTVIAVLVASVPLVPILRHGGINGNRRLSICISGSLASVYAILLGIGFLDFIRTEGGDGPNGGGSPLAAIIAMTFFAAVFVCPWLLTTLRGLRLWNQRPAAGSAQDDHAGCLVGKKPLTGPLSEDRIQ